MAKIYAPFTICEVAAKEALGFCSKGQAYALEEKVHWNKDGHLPINRSGCTLSSNPIAVTGFARVAEAALQVTGKADEKQLERASTAVATAILMGGHSII